MLKKLKFLASQLKRELTIYQLVLKHPQTPWIAKLILWMAIGYLLLPFDLIPDFIPVLGQLDEVIILPILLWCALLIIPNEVLENCRMRVQADEKSDLDASH